MFAETDNTNWYCQRCHWELRTQSPQNLNKIGQKGCVLVHISILPHSRIKKKSRHQFTFFNELTASIGAGSKEGYNMLQHTCTTSAFYCVFNNLRPIKYPDRG